MSFQLFYLSQQPNSFAIEPPRSLVYISQLNLDLHEKPGFNLSISCFKFQIGDMYTVARVSRENTGGGEGVELLAYEPFENRSDLFTNCPNTSGMYSHKVYKLSSKMSWWIRRLVPKNKSELDHEVWNAFPHMKSVMQVFIDVLFCYESSDFNALTFVFYEFQNDEILSKEKIFVKVESLFVEDKGAQENVISSHDTFRLR
jgi:hypothetical protein